MTDEVVIEERSGTIADEDEIEDAVEIDEVHTDDPPEFEEPKEGTS